MKIPHNLFPRFLQTLSIAGVAGLLYLGSTSGIPLSFGSVKTEAITAEKSTEASTEKKISSAKKKKKKKKKTPSQTEVLPQTDSFYATPFAVSQDGLTKLQEELSQLFRLHPDYLPKLTELSMSWEQLEGELTSRINTYSGDWSIYIKDLSNGNVININEHPMESASLIKLYIMGAVLERIEDGKLEKTDKIDSLLSEMITVSDNNASNELVRYLSEEHNHKEGLTVVNDFINRHNFEDTQHVNGLSDRNLWYDSTKTNETSARDCGELLASVYDGKLVSHLASRKMENLLLGQKVTYKIPTALPSEAISASKTGEISNAENDAAIVYSPGGDFVLCIMSSDWDSGNTAVNRIREITKLVYNHFNPPQPDTFEE